MGSSTSPRDLTSKPHHLLLGPLSHSINLLVLLSSQSLSLLSQFLLYKPSEHLTSSPHNDHRGSFYAECSFRYVSRFAYALCSIMEVIGHCWPAQTRSLLWSDCRPTFCHLGFCDLYLILTNHHRHSAASQGTLACIHEQTKLYSNG